MPLAGREMLRLSEEVGEERDGSEAYPLDFFTHASTAADGLLFFFFFPMNVVLALWSSPFTYIFIFVFDFLYF
jgi:hypothetical protein